MVMVPTHLTHSAIRQIVHRVDDFASINHGNVITHRYYPYPLMQSTQNNALKPYTWDEFDDKDLLNACKLIDCDFNQSGRAEMLQFLSQFDFYDDYLPIYMLEAGFGNHVIKYNIPLKMHKFAAFRLLGQKIKSTRVRLDKPPFIDSNEIVPYRKSLY